MILLFTLHLVLLVTLQRDARQEAWYALLLLDPVPHELRKVLWTAVTSPHKLHLHVLSLAVRLEDERRVQVELGGDANLTVRVESELNTKDGGDGLFEFGALGLEDLQGIEISRSHMMACSKDMRDRPAVSGGDASPSA